MDILEIKTVSIIEKHGATWIDSLFDMTNDKRIIKTDYFINGTSLSDSLDHCDFICPFGEYHDELLLNFIAIFTGGSQSLLYNKNVELYVCPCCGDSGCGVYSFQLQVKSDRVIWSNFIFETHYQLNQPSEVHEEFTKLGPFVFDKSQYMKVFEDLKP